MFAISHILQTPLLSGELFVAAWCSYEYYGNRKISWACSGHGGNLNFGRFLFWTAITVLIAIDIDIDTGIDILSDTQHCPWPAVETFFQPLNESVIFLQSLENATAIVFVASKHYISRQFAQTDLCKVLNGVTSKQIQYVTQKIKIHAHPVFITT